MSIGYGICFALEAGFNYMYDVSCSGYLPPEFIEKQILSSKFDIFSLGVVVIKVMAGPGGYSRCVDMPSREFVKLVRKQFLH